MFIRNSWYVAAIPSEIGRTPLARTILGEPIVLFRKADGAVVALHDRCCHRLLPLSVGKVIEDNIRCAYHGFVYDCSGRCVHVPGMAHVPAVAKVRSYPIIERHGYVWIWMGPAELAVDESTIPQRLFVGDHPDWDALDSYVHMKCRYELIADNLHDASHAEFVHAKSLGVEGLGDAMRKQAEPDTNRFYACDVKADSIVHTWRVLNQPAAPAFGRSLALRLGRENYAENVDWYLETIWTPPGCWTFTPYTTPVGSKPQDGAWWVSVIVITPETPTTTHYFFKDAQTYARHDRRHTQLYQAATREAFDEDKRICEAQQQALGDRDVMDFDVVSFKGDRPSMMARRMLKALADGERVTGTSSAPTRAANARTGAELT